MVLPHRCSSVFHPLLGLPRKVQLCSLVSPSASVTAEHDWHWTCAALQTHWDLVLELATDAGPPARPDQAARASPGDPAGAAVRRHAIAVMDAVDRNGLVAPWTAAPHLLALTTDPNACAPPHCLAARASACLYCPSHRLMCESLDWWKGTLGQGPAVHVGTSDSSTNASRVNCCRYGIDMPVFGMMCQGIETLLSRTVASLCLPTPPTWSLAANNNITAPHCHLERPGAGAGRWRGARCACCAAWRASRPRCSRPACRPACASPPPSTPRSLPRSAPRSP